MFARETGGDSVIKILTPAHRRLGNWFFEASLIVKFETIRIRYFLSFFLCPRVYIYIYVRKIDDDNLTIATEKFTTRIGDGTYLIRENWKLNRE